jgi:hypothetical protein
VVEVEEGVGKGLVGVGRDKVVGSRVVVEGVGAVEGDKMELQGIPDTCQR